MSVLHDVKSKLSLNSTILPQVGTTDITGTAVDTQLSHGVGIMAHIGTSGDTLSGSVKIEMEVQHSDASGSGFVACADSDIVSAVTGTNTGTFAVIDAAADDDQIYKCNYIGSKRYVKVVANFTGTHTNGCPLSATVVLLPTQLPA